MTRVNAKRKGRREQNATEDQTEQQGGENISEIFEHDREMTRQEVWVKSITVQIVHMEMQMQMRTKNEVTNKKSSSKII